MAPPRLSLRWRSVATVLALLAGSFAALLFVAPDASALTYVGGFVTADTDWDATGSPYIVVQHVTVLPGVRLRIRDGATVRFNPGLALFVEGRLEVDGFPGNEVLFQRNNTFALLAPQGIQFNASSTGFVRWSIIDRMDRGVTAIDSSPDVMNNVIDHAFIGVALGNSFSRVEWNNVNDTQWGVYAINGGAPYIANNYITNAAGGLPIGVYVTAGAAANLWFNTIDGVSGRNPPSAGGPGAPGAAGSAAIGVIVDGAPWATIQQNTVTYILGGRGGDGMGNPGGAGGKGGEGGAAAGIVVANTATVDVADNTITNVNSGRGGNGGQGNFTNTGGAGGIGGSAAAIQMIGVWTTTSVSRSWIDGVGGGGGGNGGDGSVDDGAGGGGGEAYGVLTYFAADVDASGNNIRNVVGGPGGNSTTAGTGNNVGGFGGPATGMAVNGVVGSAQLHSTSIMSIWGGDGGRGAVGGAGGNATGAFAFGDANFNATVVTGTWVQDISSGDGAVGFRTGGNAGVAAGILSAYVTPFLGANGFWDLSGGDGGDAIDGTNGGRGGDAVGEGYFMVPTAWSAGSWINTVAKGLAGFGAPVQISYASGFYVEGGSSLTSQLTIENATIANVDDRDIWVSNEAVGTTINTPFDPLKLMVHPTSILYVMNYLSTAVYWSDGFTPVPGANVVITEDGTTVWDFVTATGFDQWLLTLDRYYPGSVSATDVLNVASVSYLAYTFANNPRTVDMASSNFQSFVMTDTQAPTSAASPLPPYKNTLSFNVDYTASDGSGSGLDNITLWYRRNAGAWTLFGSQFAGNFGTFFFTAPGDGTYEFETVATDQAGNTEAGPGTNESWTIVDTVRPTSRVNALSPWTNTLSFVVSWGPDPGVTDIARYTVQYNRGFGWTNWLVDTTQTTGTFTAAFQSVYQFRSIATDFAGNVENAGANDTWTIVDTLGPTSLTSPLATYQTALTFLVSWSSESPDVASFRIEFQDNGAGWTTWIASTTSTSQTYATGQDGHTYEFRAIATDQAGNVESQPGTGNESWTIVDVTLPRSLVAPLPIYRSNVQFTVSWAPEAGVTDIVSYRIDVNDNGAGWTTWIASTTLTSQQYTGQDGHTYEFRSLARDAAGNLESKSTADASTTVDTTAPTTTGTPTGTIGNNNWYTSAVTVTLVATDGTSGVASIAYRVDSGPWQTYAGPIVVNAQGSSHKIDFTATDNAGNTENVKSVAFDIDLAAPTTSATVSGTLGDNGWMTSAVLVTLSATDSASGVASIQYLVDGDPLTDAFTTYTAPVSVSSDGTHRVYFRATDQAGFVETTSFVLFSIDKVAPQAVPSPRGTTVPPTARIYINFTEPMNPTSVQLAFSITPDVSGTFLWNTNFTSLTWVPDQELPLATTLFVSISQSAKDVAGNALVMLPFQFTTSAVPPSGGTVEFGSLWWILIVVAAILGSLFLLRGRLPVGAKAAPVAAEVPKKEEPTIDDVFLLYHDGILIKHETRRLKPDIDTDILSGMLTAVQSFVKDSFRSEEGHLDKMTFGEMHILIGRGRWLILAAMMGGEGTDSMAYQMQRCIEDMEASHPQVIETWDGNMTLAKTLAPYIKKLIRGEYPSAAPNV